MSQDSQVPIDLKKSWKKCCAHVYITRLIKVLQLSERKDGLQEKPAHSSQNERLHLRPRASVDSQTNAINGSNSVASFNNMAHSTSEKNSADIQNAILLYKRLLQDQQRGYTTPGLCTSLKQVGLFLTISGLIFFLIFWKFTGFAGFWLLIIGCWRLWCGFQW